MRISQFLHHLLGLAFFLSFGGTGAAVAVELEPVELTGRAGDFWHQRQWRGYYWRKDCSFLLEDKKTGASWRIISRETTPAYRWEMGPAYTGLKVDWRAKPRVRVIGVAGVDRVPAEFYHFKLNDPRLATALIIYVETEPGKWREFYVNNWFHRWGEEADKAVHLLYAGKEAPYDVYGWVGGMAAPFSKSAQAIVDKHRNTKLLYHGLVRTTKSNAFGFEIELLHLIGRNPQTGGGDVLFGPPGTLPLLDNRKP